ncbi:hypothetical protein L6452_31255 [Arctium lappa]|uniref:Uncharacterized protein n=1 Tax=Arctium lappa TaxID=4217 RepID=A0ACB8ZKI3_ARCLA|nr:hypothetical protein L6452_31255 [Arctium lappa]
MQWFQGEGAADGGGSAGEEGSMRLGGFVTDRWRKEGRSKELWWWRTKLIVIGLAKVKKGTKWEKEYAISHLNPN